MFFTQVEEQAALRATTQYSVSHTSLDHIGSAGFQVYRISYAHYALHSSYPWGKATLVSLVPFTVGIE